MLAPVRPAELPINRLRLLPARALVKVMSQPPPGAATTSTLFPRAARRMAWTELGPPFGSAFQAMLPVVAVAGAPAGPGKAVNVRVKVPPVALGRVTRWISSTRGVGTPRSLSP